MELLHFNFILYMMPNNANNVLLQKLYLLTILTFVSCPSWSLRNCLHWAFLGVWGYLSAKFLCCRVNSELPLLWNLKSKAKSKPNPLLPGCWVRLLLLVFSSVAPERSEGSGGAGCVLLVCRVEGEGGPSFCFSTSCHSMKTREGTHIRILGGEAWLGFW